MTASGGRACIRMEEVIVNREFNVQETLKGTAIIACTL